MIKKLYSKFEQELLLENKYIKKISEKTITFTSEFKIYAVKRNIEEFIPPRTIFLEAGFNLDVIGPDKPKECLKRWRKIYRLKGVSALLIETRGTGSTGRPSNREMTPEEKYRKMEIKLRRLERENELLKKLELLERSVIKTTSDKYALIQDLMTKCAIGISKHLRNLFNVKYLCEFISVSRSGYYKWLKNADKRAERAVRELEDYKLIKQIFDKKKQKSGWRTIRMDLETLNIIMNHKKIRRIMNKYGIRTKVRKANPYKHIFKATKEHRTFPNKLNREFNQNAPFKVFGTDITYLISNSGKKSYLSVLLDYASGEVIQYCISKKLNLDLSVKLVEDAFRNKKSEQSNDIMIHSDQGVHYTNPSYIKLLESKKITQSMSRKGNCLDNAPVESFFGHLKDELDYKCYENFEELKELIDKHIYEYNNSRKRWTKNKMAPVDYRNHLLAA